MSARLVWIQGLTYSAFIAAVFVLWFSGRETLPAFKGLVIGLIFLGMFGIQLATRVTRSLTDIVIALTGTKS